MTVWTRLAKYISTCFFRSSDIDKVEFLKRNAHGMEIAKWNADEAFFCQRIFSYTYEHTPACRTVWGAFPSSGARLAVQLYESEQLQFWVGTVYPALGRLLEPVEWVDSNQRFRSNLCNSEEFFTKIFISHWF